MGRPLTPAPLLEGPFTVSEARAHGLTKDHLESRAWHRLSRGVYCHAPHAGDPRLLLAAIANTAYHPAPPSRGKPPPTSTALTTSFPRESR